MTIDPDRLADLLARKLVALVKGRWTDLADSHRAGSFPGGTSLAEGSGGRAWILLTTEAESDPARRLGAAMAVARRAGATELHLLVDAPAPAAAILARRAALFSDPPQVWTVDGATIAPAQAIAPPIAPALAPEVELYRPVLAAAGLTPVAEGGNLLGELLGLEVARVVVDDDGSARIEAGVGRFDREAGAMMYAHQGETDALARVVDLVAGIRTASAERHPLNTLVTERWLRAALVAHPELVGAAALEPVASAVERANLLEVGVASARGTDLEGRPLVVTCSTVVDLDLVPSAADDRLAADPDARLVLAVPSRNVVPVTTELAGRLRAPADVVPVADGWQALAESRA